MEKYTSELLANLYLELQEASMETGNSLQQFDQSYNIAVVKISELKDFMQSYTFKSKDEEIRFFKEIKPLFYKEAIYYNELLSIESQRPVATGEPRKLYYEKVLDRIMVFFDRNRDFYNYYRMGKINMDEQYFQRNPVMLPLQQVNYLDLDTHFSTPYSLNLAHIQAYEQLCTYLNSNYYKTGDAIIETDQQKGGTTWSTTKAALIELAIALYFSGSVNFGRGGFKKFISELEAFFHIQLGNVYRVFLGMVIRKKEPAPFLLHLTDTFKRKLDEKSI